MTISKKSADYIFVYLCLQRSFFLCFDYLLSRGKMNDYLKDDYCQFKQKVSDLFVLDPGHFKMDLVYSALPNNIFTQKWFDYLTTSSKADNSKLSDWKFEEMQELKEQLEREMLLINRNN